MSKYVCLFGDSSHSYYLNMDLVEQLDVEHEVLWMNSGEEYRLSHEDFVRILEYVRKNSI